MRLTPFLLVIFTALMFVIGQMKKEDQKREREAQEEESLTYEGHPTFKVTYEVQSPDEEAILDIIWMKKAAQTAIKAGLPYFNVSDQKITKRYVQKYNQSLSVIEGLIELSDDPLNSDFDAYEIEDLILTND
jgi:hypothetical protein